MNLTIKLNSESIEAAIRKIEDYQRTMQEKCQELAKRLALIGMDVITATYDGAAYAGTNDIEVHLEFEGNRFDLGSKVGFLKANITKGLSHSETADELKAFLKEIIETI